MSDPVLDALAALSAQVAALAPAATPTVNVTDLWDVFVLANREKLRSWRDYAQRWRDHVGPAFGARDAAVVAPGDVDAYRSQRRAAGAAIATVNREVALLRRLLNFGVRRGKLARSQLHGPGMTRELIHSEDNVRTYDQRDVLLFRSRRELARAALRGPRKGPHRVTPDHHAAEPQEVERKSC